MIRISVLTILLVAFISNVNVQTFNAQQKAWLYKIVMKTDPLKRNWEDFFIYKGDLPCIEERFAINGRIVTKRVKKWKQIEAAILADPDILSIDFIGIQKNSPGLAADASVKLALWELYSVLKEAYKESPPFSVNKTANYFYSEMYKTLPVEQRKNGEVHKKFITSFYNLLNPSLPLNRKAEFLSEIKKISIPQQKKILEKWHQLVNEYVSEQSAFFFKKLAGTDVYYKGNLLAVGEGSGSSGLLSEYEKGGDEWIDTGTGKGIGLFTYQMGVKRGKLSPKFESDIKIKSLNDEPTLLHLSLWGMDSSKKPLILIEKDDKSYMLFADVKSKEISPDPNSASGISYLDRLVEFEFKKINEPIRDLNKPNGLLNIYNKEIRKKEVILNQLKVLELEIDSINRLGNKSVNAIESRKSKINVNLSNLNDKESRLKELERKISVEYKKIDRAKNKLREMELLLGDSIQKWTKSDSIYVYDDGTIFNSYTQDLIFPEDSISSQIKVKLLAASFSLGSERKDEVQLYVNTTGGVNRFMKDMELTEKDSTIQKTIFKQSFFFEPDVFDCGCAIGEEHEKLLAKIGNQISKENKKLELSLRANGVDTVNQNLIEEDQVSAGMYHRQVKNNPAYRRSRRVDIEILESKESYHIIIDGYTDGMNTRLSLVSDNKRRRLGNYKSKQQSLNSILSALRVSYALNEVARLTRIDFSNKSVDLIPLRKSIEVNKLMKE